MKVKWAIIVIEIGTEGTKTFGRLGLQYFKGIVNFILKSVIEFDCLSGVYHIYFIDIFL